LARRSWWQAPHIWSLWALKWVVVGNSIWWAVWQSVQTGALAFPAARAVPWMLAWYVFATAGWHCPQVTAILAWFVRETWSTLRLMSCTPWQSLHDGAN